MSAGVGAGSRAGRWVGAALAWLVLNTLLTFENAWPTPWPRWSPRLSFELAMALVLLALWVGWRGASAKSTRRIVGGLALLTVGLALARYIDVTVTALFGRPINPYWDGRHLIDVLAMSGGGLWQGLVAALALATAALLLFWLVRAGWLRLADALASGPARGATVGIGALMLASFAAQGIGGRDTRCFFSLPVVPVVARQAELALVQLNGAVAAHPLGDSPRFDGDLSALGGADVLLVFAESYGATTLDNPAHAAQLAPARKRFKQAIEAGGRKVVSARVRSPTFAGASWLAHAALLSGVDTADPLDYERLLASSRPSLVGHFKSHGWRTVNWMPGLQRPWPEGGFYGFDRYVDADHTGYRGASFGYWRVPDQASIALIEAQELAPLQPAQPHQPSFVVFPTVASHAPFRPIPPLVADWSRFYGTDAYSAADLAQAVDEAPPGADLAPAYLRSIEHTFDWLGDWLAHRAPRRLLTIVIGDHQPLAGVSGANASWDVPVHLISSDSALLRRFEAEGFSPGLLPGPRPLGKMNELTDVLLRVFEGG